MFEWESRRNRTEERSSAARTMPEARSAHKRILKRREEDERGGGLTTGSAQAITNFAGSILSSAWHVWRSRAWIALNLGLVPGYRVFDPTFAVLGHGWLRWRRSSFHFRSDQPERMAEKDDERSDLNLQISLLAEQSDGNCSRFF